MVAIAAYSRLFGDQQEVVLLTLLDMDVLATQQSRRVNHGGGIGDFLLVDAHTAGLDHLACLTLGGEYLRFGSQQFQERNTLQSRL